VVFRKAGAVFQATTPCPLLAKEGSGHGVFRVFVV